jgi:hypothetical protein
MTVSPARLAFCGGIIRERGKDKTKMSDSEDKNVHHGDKLPRSKRRLKNQFVSDSYTFSELGRLIGVTRNGIASWESEVGRRLEFAMLRFGKDKSVHLTEKSWKQLQRYFAGDPVSATILRNVAMAAGHSLEYLADGKVSTTTDAVVESSLVDRQLFLMGAVNSGALGPLTPGQSQVATSLHEALLQRWADLQGGGRRDVEPRPSRLFVDDELFGIISEEIARIYREEKARLGPADAGRLLARTIERLLPGVPYIESFKDSSGHNKLAVMAALMPLLEDIRGELRKLPNEATSTGKRLA